MISTRRFLFKLIPQAIPTTPFLYGQAADSVLVFGHIIEPKGFLLLLMIGTLFAIGLLYGLYSQALPKL